MIFNPVYGGASAPNLGSKTITANGTYLASSDNLDGYDEVTANVPNTYTASDEGKVVSSGALVAQTSTTKTANGTYDTTLNNEVIVNVSPKIYTGEDADYVFNTANELICKLGGRAFYKTYADKAYVAYYTNQYQSGYTGPVLVSETVNGVICSYNNTSGGTVTYNGTTYYYSTTNYYMSGNLTSSSGRALKLPNTYASVSDAALALLALALSGNEFTSNGSYPVPNGYDGYGDVKVNVSPTLQSKTGISITDNGSFSFTADNGYDGLSVVSGTVNVSGGGGGGTTILSGTTAPSSSQGSDGSLYLEYYEAVSDLEKITNASNGYIRLDTLGGKDVKFVVKCNIHGGGAYATPIGSRSSTSSSNQLIFTKYNNANNLYYANNSGDTSIGNFSAFLDKDITITLSNSLIRVEDGNGNYLQATPSNINVFTTPPMVLFNLGTGTSSVYGSATACYMDLYSCDVYMSDNLTKHLLPKTYNSTIGLMDMMNGDFFASQGSTLTATSRATPLTVRTIHHAYAKVSGAWQNLIGTNISDINLGS